MKKDDDIINESSIDDLIEYSEAENEEDDFDTDSPVDAAREEAAETAEEVEAGELVFGEEKKSSKRVIIIGAVIAAIALIVFFGIDSGLFGSYRENFSSNFSRVFSNFEQDGRTIVKETSPPAAEYKTEIKSSALLSPESAAEAAYMPYKGGLICAVSNHMSYIDASGAVAWETDTSVVEPILAAEGNYILLASRGRSKLCLYSDKRLLYDTDDPDIILAAKVSANGDAVLVTDKVSYKGGVSVYNKTGDQIYSWGSGSGAVICADISSSSRRLAVALLNTDERVKTILQFFDVNEEKSYAQLSVDDTVIFDMGFSGRTLSVFGDNRVATFSDSGRVINNTTVESASLTHTAMDSKGNKLLAVNDGGSPVLARYNKRGAAKESAAVNGVADFIDICGKRVIYNTGRDIYIGKINSKDITKYTAAMDIKKLMLLSENSFAVIYSNSLEIVTV